MKRLLMIAVLVAAGGLKVHAQQEVRWGDWKIWGDQGNGTYRNPVVPADFSDIDCIRVGNDYYAISSTFQFSPGMTILHSRDLVNWEICGHAIADLTQISQELNWTRMNRYGKGVWAGTLRYYKGRFYIFFGTPDEGYFMTSAPQPQGPWEPLTPLLAESGWDDCSMIWDDDGQAYFVGTHFADGYNTYLFRMRADGKEIDRASAVLVNTGSHREANKLIKVNDWYYLVFSEHKQETGRYVMAKRSRKVMGPYLEERQLALASREAMEPNQGGIIQGPDSNWYFLTHHGTGDWSGRVMSLLPVTWEDDWPIVGKVLPEKIGTMAWTGKMPATGGKRLSIKKTDHFGGTSLSPQWQWNYQPRKDKYSFTARPGWLRLEAFAPLKPDDLMQAGNTVTQRVFRKAQNEVVIKMDIRNMADGQKAGLCHFSSQHAALGVVKSGPFTYLEYRENGKVVRGDIVRRKTIWLRSVWGLDGKSRSYYSLNGRKYISFGDVYQMVWGNYRGDRIGIYSFNDKGDGGWVDVDYVEYR